jgi:hypothetical protein
MCPCVLVFADQVMSVSEYAKSRADVSELVDIVSASSAAEAAFREVGDRVDAERMAAVPVKLAGVRHALAAAMADLAREPAQEADGARRKFLPVAALLPAGRGAPAAVRARRQRNASVTNMRTTYPVGDCAVGR